MAQNENSLVHLKDAIEHISDCQAQLEWAQDRFTIQVLTDSILRDLDCCRRLCESMRKKSKAAVLMN